MRVTILSAIYDDYDTVKSPLKQAGFEVDWVMVTDNPDLKAPGWTVIHEPRPGMHPNRAAKFPKMMPWEYTDVEYSIWIDASYRVTSPYFARDMLAYMPLGQFVHPWRNCVYDEADEVMRIKKHNGQPCLRQVSRYRERGFPAGWGLWASGVIARQHTLEVETFGEHWMYECTHWSYRDQLSEPYCLWENNLRPVSLPGNHLTNPWVRYEGSSRH